MESLPSPDLSSDPAAASASVEGKVQVGRGKKRAMHSQRDGGMRIVMEEADEE
jgi:hypothetical protein